MLEKYRVASQLVAFGVVLSSIELVSLNFCKKIGLIKMIIIGNEHVSGSCVRACVCVCVCVRACIILTLGGMRV
jgi:hypothetical protein